MMELPELATRESQRPCSVFFSICWKAWNPSPMDMGRCPAVHTTEEERAGREKGESLSSIIQSPRAACCIYRSLSVCLSEMEKEVGSNLR